MFDEQPVMIEWVPYPGAAEYQVNVGFETAAARVTSTFYRMGRKQTETHCSLTELLHDAKVINLDVYNALKIGIHALDENGLVIGSSDALHLLSDSAKPETILINKQAREDEVELPVVELDDFLSNKLKKDQEVLGLELVTDLKETRDPYLMLWDDLKQVYKVETIQKDLGTWMNLDLQKLSRIVPGNFRLMYQSRESNIEMVNLYFEEGDTYTMVKVAVGSVIRIQSGDGEIVNIEDKPAKIGSWRGDGVEYLAMNYDGYVLKVETNLGRDTLVDITNQIINQWPKCSKLLIDVDGERSQNMTMYFSEQVLDAAEIGDFQRKNISYIRDDFGDYLEFTFASLDGKDEFKLRQYDTPRVYYSRAKYEFADVTIREHNWPYTVHSEEGTKTSIIYELYWEHDNCYYVIVGEGREMLLEQIERINRCSRGREG